MRAAGQFLRISHFLQISHASAKVRA